MTIYTATAAASQASPGIGVTGAVLLGLVVGLVVGILIGLALGERRALTHLGRHDLRGRRAAIRESKQSSRWDYL